MRAFKILVVVIGIMIVGGFAALVVIIIGRVSHRGPAPAETPKAFARPIDIPRGARIEAMTAGGNRLVVGLELPDGPRLRIAGEFRQFCATNGYRLESFPDCPELLADLSRWPSWS
jgi:Family of unknown function (DUF6476)